MQRDLEYADLKRYIKDKRKENQIMKDRIHAQMAKYHRRRNRFMAMFVDSDR